MSVFDLAPDSEDEGAQVVNVSSEEEGDEFQVRSDAPPLRFRGYRRGQELGSGASGKVFLCHRKECAGGYAVKAVDLRRLQLSPNSEREYTSLCREVEILKSLPPHPAIVQLIDAFQEAHWFLLVLELVGGGDLFTVLTAREPPQLKEREAAFVVKQLANGLTFLHSQNVIHRDLKLENILVASERREQSLVLYSIKITDFGLSKSVGVGFSAAHSVVGTRPYTAPEVERGGGDMYDFGADLWCLGVVLYILLSGHFPFDKTPKIQGELDRISMAVKGTKTVRSILGNLLRLDPKTRMSLEALSGHEWLQDSADGGEAERPAKRKRPVPPQQRPASEIPVPVERPGTPVPARPSALRGLSAASTSPVMAADAAAVSPRSPSTSAASTQQMPPPAPAQQMPPPAPPPAVEEPAKACTAPEEEPLEQGGSQRSPAAISSDVQDWLAHIYKLERAASAVRPAIATLGPSASSGGPAEVVYYASPQPDVMQVHMAIPTSLCSAVIGKGMVQMKQLAATLGCKVRMASLDGLDETLVSTIGNYNQVAVVQEIVHSRVLEACKQEGREAPVQVEVVLLVRAEAAGVVIGKQGFVLSQIRKQSGARIQLLHEQIKGQRPCVLAGELQNVLRAERHVFHLVRIVRPAEPVTATLELPFSPPPASPPLPWGSPFPATPFPSPPPSP